jgi:hypothetical protein
MEIIRSGRRVHFGQFEMDEHAHVTVLPHRRDIVRAPGVCPIFLVPESDDIKPIAPFARYLLGLPSLLQRHLHIQVMGYEGPGVGGFVD